MGGAGAWDGDEGTREAERPGVLQTPVRVCVLSGGPAGLDLLEAVGPSEVVRKAVGLFCRKCLGASFVFK